jgi:hypothetical protein
LYVFFLAKRKSIIFVMRAERVYLF